MSGELCILKNGHRSNETGRVIWTLIMIQMSNSRNSSAQDFALAAKSVRTCEFSEIPLQYDCGSLHKGPLIAYNIL